MQNKKDTTHMTLDKNFLEIFLDSTTFCVGICDGEDWLVQACNNKAVKYFRDSGERTIGLSLLSFLEKKEGKNSRDRLFESKPGEEISIVLQRHKYIFFWNYLDTLVLGNEENRPKTTQSNTSQNKRENIRKFFFFYEASSSTDEAYTLLGTELEVILDSIHDGIWIIDGNGITLHANKALKRITGLNPKDLIGIHVSIPMQEGKFDSCVTLDALEKKKTVTRFDDYATGIRCINTSIPILDEAGEVRRVVACIRNVTELEDLQAKLAKAEREAYLYKHKLENFERMETSGLLGDSQVMQNCIKQLVKLAKSGSEVLITGETGTGKSLAASVIHKKSPRADAPFIAINCASIPDSLIDSELFGYQKGAFTGANQAGKKGYFELADKGTLFLDEIAELPLNMQAKLLHVLDNYSFHRVGGGTEIKVDVRIITATNKSLEELVKAGTFRADLYYRLHVLTVNIPALREHETDIPLLANHFLVSACKRLGTSKAFSRKALQYFTDYNWPGNVRELRGAVEYLAAMVEGNIIHDSDLSGQILNKDIDATVQSNKQNQLDFHDLRDAVHNLEYTMIHEAILLGGSTYKAAKLLNISQSTVVRKSQQLGILIKE